MDGVSPVEGVERAEEEAELGGDKPRLDRPSRSTPESAGAGRRDIRRWEGREEREDIFWNFLGERGGLGDGLKRASCEVAGVIPVEVSKIPGTCEKKRVFQCNPLTL